MFQWCINLMTVQVTNSIDFLDINSASTIEKRENWEEKAIS